MGGGVKLQLFPFEISICCLGLVKGLRVKMGRWRMYSSQKAMHCSELVNVNPKGKAKTLHCP